MAREIRLPTADIYIAWRLSERVVSHCQIERPCKIFLPEDILQEYCFRSPTLPKPLKNNGALRNASGARARVHCRPWRQGDHQARYPPWGEPETHLLHNPASGLLPDVLPISQGEEGRSRASRTCVSRQRILVCREPWGLA
jgi:hypothetical protein